MVVEYVGFAVAAHRAVTKPAKPLVPLRAVGRHATIVAPDSPESVVVDLVDDRVGSLEMTCDGHLVVHHLPLEIAEFRLVLQAFDLDVAETVIDIFRMPDNRFAVLCDVGVQNLGGAKVGEIESAVLVQKLGEFHSDGVALLEAFRLDLEAAHHILSHVQNVAVIGLRDGDRLHDVLNGDVRVRLENQLATRSVHQRRVRPSRVIVAGFCPAGQLLARVVSLAIKLVVGADRTLAGNLPTLIADNGRCAAISVNNV